jgi:chromate transporter
VVIVSMKIVIDLIKSFMIIGLSACGGGLVTIPLIQHEMVNVRHWLVSNDIAKILSIAQMTPGPIAINAATFVGFKIAGIIGSVIATLAVIFPSLIILLSISSFLKNIKHNEVAIKINQGIQAGVLSLILFAIWSFGSTVITSTLDLFITIAAFLMLLFLKNKVHPVFVIVLCGIVGLIIY